ncbi:MAG TPA: rhomboid family intramembrane serine protease [Clostridiaceae bacterium]|nr:rhomboid family intramembrane serine protease [Clostridiaceae bacterium]
MKWLDKLERKFGRYAIKNLMMYIIALNMAVYLIMLTDRTGWVIRKLMLIPSLLLKGEIWRLFTYIFIPPESSMIFIFFVLYFYYLIGTSLEQQWGSFRFNVYYLIGMLGTTIAAFISGTGATGVYLNLSLFLAFAYMYPNYEILLFFFVPIKVKYLGWLNIAFIAYAVLTEPLPGKVAAVASIINFIVFFGRDFINFIKTKIQVHRNRKKFFRDIRGRR